MADVPLQISLPLPPSSEDQVIQHLRDLGWSLGDMYTTLAVAINSGTGGSDGNIDGGAASASYMTDQIIDCGGA